MTIAARKMKGAASDFFTSLNNSLRGLLSLTFAIKVGPLTGLNKARPVERMLVPFSFERRELHLPERFAATQSLLQAFVIVDHHLASYVVAHWPQAHHQRLGSRKHERAPQTVHALAGLYLANSRVTGGQCNQPRTPQIQARRLERGKYAVVVTAPAQICARQCKPRTQQWILDPCAGIDGPSFLAASIVRRNRNIR